MALKQQFLDSLGSISGTLRSIVSRLQALGVARDQLVAWAVDAGYSEGFVRSLLSKLFCKSGHRARRPGGGRRTPREALELLALAADRYGDKAPRFLLAAYRAAKARPRPGPNPDVMKRTENALS